MAGFASCAALRDPRDEAGQEECARGARRVKDTAGGRKLLPARGRGIGRGRGKGSGRSRGRGRAKGVRRTRYNQIKS